MVQKGIEIWIRTSGKLKIKRDVYMYIICTYYERINN